MTTMLFTLFMSLNARGDAVCATKPLTTLRKSAAGGAAVSWRVARYMPFLRLDTKAGWSKVKDFEGEIHYARAGDVTNKVRCVVVKTNSASLKREPKASAPAADIHSVDRYTPFLRVADQENWVQVQDEAGRKSWIAAAQVWKPVMVNDFSF